MSKKVQLEGNFGGSREDVYPATMAEIVYTQDGKNLEEKMNETNAQLSDIIANNLTVSVKDYGALGDGVTDDTQAFINALNALKPNGGYLFIPKTPNFYRITNQIEITNEHGYVVVYGEGKTSHIKLTQKSSNGHLIGFLGTPASKLKGGCAKIYNYQLICQKQIKTIIVLVLCIRIILCLIISILAPVLGKGLLHNVT